jgi:hypothetical protein
MRVYACFSLIARWPQIKVQTVVSERLRRKKLFLLLVDALLHTNKKANDLRIEQIQKGQFSNKNILL